MPKIYLKSDAGVTFECCKYQGDPVEHKVFDNRDDFEEFFMQKAGAIPTFEPSWRIAKAGDWTYADDGRVLQILKKKPITHQSDGIGSFKFSKEGYVVTCVGSFVCTKHYWMDTDFSVHPSRNSFVSNYGKTKSYQQRIMDRKYNTVRESEFILNLARGDNILVAYKKVFKCKSNKVAMKRAMFLLRQERIMRALKDQLEDVAGRLGITMEYIMGGIKKLADKERTPPVVKLDALSRLGGYIGMDDQEQSSTGLIGSGFASEKLASGEDIQRPEELEKFDPDSVEQENEHVIDSVTGDQL